MKVYTERTYLLREDLKILLDRSENNFVGTLKIMSNAAKNCDILATSLSVLQLFIDSSTKLLCNNIYKVYILFLKNNYIFYRLSN